MAGEILASRTLVDYIAAHTRQSPAERRLRAETARLPEAHMLLNPDAAALLGLLVRLTGARHVLEVGTFTGCSALAMALALPADGRLTACDVSEEWTAIARRHWRAAGVDDRIDLRLGPARDTLAALVEQGRSGAYDLAFIDADKTGYAAYYEAALELLRPGGLVVFDNLLWSGAVADPAVRDPDTLALRALNDAVHADPRVEAGLLSVGDGFLLAWKRPDRQEPA